MTLYDAEPRKIAVIPCGFAPDEFWPIAPRFARRALGLPSDVPVLLSVGRLVPRKGVDNVIRALGVLVRRLGVPAELLVVGGNSDIAGSGVDAGDRPAAGHRGRGRRRRSSHVHGPAPARAVEALLQRGRCVRHDAVVRVVRHDADRGDGVRHARRRCARRRHPVQRRSTGARASWCRRTIRSPSRNG